METIPAVSFGQARIEGPISTSGGDRSIVSSLNRETIAARDPDAPVNCWRMPFDPGTVAKFADCGVWPMDERGEVIPAVLAWLGEDPNGDNKPSSQKPKRS